MQIKINCKTDTIELPLNYQHILQSVIYKLLSVDKAQKSFVHDNGWKYDKRTYRFFQFSNLSGPYTIQNKKIIFRDSLSWEVRSIDGRLIQSVREGIEKDGVWFGDIHIEDIEVQLTDYEVESDKIQIRMMTPICAYSSDENTKKTHFYTPDEEQFYNQIQENFRRKYNAYSGIDIKNGVNVCLDSVNERDKIVTNYKGFYLTGWKGRYTLTGDRKYLNFLYQVGLGSRNSQGFGMFDVIS